MDLQRRLVADQDDERPGLHVVGVLVASSGSIARWPAGSRSHRRSSM